MCPGRDIVDANDANNRLDQSIALCRLWLRYGGGGSGSGSGSGQNAPGFLGYRDSIPPHQPLRIRACLLGYGTEYWRDDRGPRPLPVAARTRAQQVDMVLICRIKPADGPRDRCGRQSMSFQRGAWPGMMMDGKRELRSGRGRGRCGNGREMGPDCGDRGEGSPIDDGSRGIWWVGGW